MFVLRGAPIPGQLDDRGLLLVAIADEGEGELAAGEVVLAQEFHPELVAIELERFVEIVDAEHRVQQTHAIIPLAWCRSGQRFESIALVSSPLISAKTSSVGAMPAAFIRSTSS